MNPRRFSRLLRLPWTSARDEVDDELRFHLETATAELIAQGASPAAARAEAERRFGTVSDIRSAVLTIEERRRKRAAGREFMSAFVADLRFALRSLWRTPMLTVIGSLTLMLGVGATTSIFSVFDGVLLRPLPYPSVGRLVSLHDQISGEGTGSFAFPEYADWAVRGAPIFSAVGAWFSTTLTLTGVDEPVVLRGARMSASVPQMLGVRPLVGRLLLPADDSVASPRVIVLSERCWRRRFNADSSVVGRTLDLSGYPFTVVGVYPSTSASRLPSELSLPASSDYWQPLRLTPANAPRSLNFMAGMALMKPGVTTASLQARMDQVNQQLRADSVTTHRMVAGDLTSEVLGSSQGMLEAIFGAALLVLLVACANVANLLLARSTARQREIAIRSAIGASRGRIISLVLSECLVRALVGGGLGVMFAFGTLAVLRNALAVRLPRFSDVSVDGPVLAFAVLLSVISGIAFGLVPALRASRTDINVVIREGGRGVAGSLRRDGFRRALIIGEIGMSYVLLAGAGLLTMSFARLIDVPKGFNPERLLSASITLPHSKYPDSTRTIAFYDQLLAQIDAIPGVVNAAVTSDLPIQGGTTGGIRIQGKNYPDSLLPTVEKRFASPAYFATIGARILKGRDFNSGDVMRGVHVAIVNRALADKLLPGENPIGRQVDFAFNTTGLQTIVGVVDNVKEQALNAPVIPALYLPAGQRSSEFMYLVVRSAIPEQGLVAAIRHELKAVDPNVPLEDVRSIHQVIDDGITSQRLMMSLLSAFSLAALVLAAIGLYGVISYSVAQRRSEIGIRTALGANRSAIVAMVFREGLWFVAIGVGGGLLVARASAQVIASQLFGVTVGEPIVYGGVALLLAVVSLAAVLAPAARAARIDPVAALRED